MIRPRTESDLDACVALAEAVHARDGYPPYLAGDLRPFLEQPPPIEAWVAEVDGQVAGHVALNPTSSDPVMELVGWAGVGVVARLFVDPTRRRQGIGRELLRTATEAAVGRRLKPVIDVGTIFTGAIALYERHGWKRVGAITLRLPGMDLEEFVYVWPVPG